MDTSYAILYFVCLFGGIALTLGSLLWGVRHPRKKGERLSAERKAWMVLPILGAVFVISAVLSLMMR